MTRPTALNVARRTTCIRVGAIEVNRSYLSLKYTLAARVDSMCLRKAKPIGELAIIFAIEDREIGGLAGFQRAILSPRFKLWAALMVDCDLLPRRHLHCAQLTKAPSTWKA
jgi:hypothetical protein